MAKITKRVLSFILVLILQVGIKAQLSGTYNIPTNYPTLSAAISALNLQGVSGPVFIEITAGYTETAPVGGYGLTATGTLANPITFRKVGAGANPLITAYTGGTGTPATATQDGIWRFIGSDYITVDGIDLSDPNAANPATMEYGYGFFKAGTSDGCQNNTIQNCVINLKTINNATGSGPAVDGSRGINMVNSLFTSQTTVITPVSSAGTNSNNKFYGNTIRNCNVAIALIGYAAPSPFTLADTGNDVGGSSSLQGNNIINFGGAAAATNPAAGVRTLAQYNLNVSYNTLNNNDGTGANHVNILRGIYVNTAVSANLVATNNTITIKTSALTSQGAAIENVSGATAANNTISINNNLIQNCTNASNTTGSFFGIYNNAASAAYLDINNNAFTGITTQGTTGSNYLIYNTGAVTNAISISNNQVTNCSNSASTSGAYYMIFNNVVSAAALTISSNTFSNNMSSASTGATHLIYNSGATSGNVTMNNNSVTTCTNSSASTGAFYGIYNNGASPSSLNITGNSFMAHRINAFSGPTHLIYNTAAFASAITITNNLVSGCTTSITSNGSYYGIYNNVASSPALDIGNNTFTGDVYASTTGSVHLVFNRGLATTTFVTNNLNNNLISNCSFSATSNSPFLGVYNSIVTSTNLSISNTTVTGNSWSAVTGLKYLVYNNGPVNGTLNLNNNLIADWTSTLNTTGSFNGIINAGSCTVALNMCGNTFTNISNSATTGGMYLAYNSGAVAGGGIITMTNNLVSGVTNSATGLADFYGIYNSGTAFSALQITNNTFTNNILKTSTGATNFIYNTGAVSTSISSINLSNNLISGCTSSISSTGSFFGIYNNNASCLSLNISNNTFTNSSVYAANGANHLVYNRGTVTNTFSTINLDNNLISNCTHSSSAAAGFYSLWNNAVTSTVTSITNNTITGSTWATATALRYLISNWGVGVSSTTISGNLVSGCTHTNNTTGFLYGIYNNYNTAFSSGSLQISNNTFTNNASTATTGETHYINSSGVSSNTFNSITITNNLLANCSGTVNGGGGFFGIYNNTASSNNLNISQNTFTNCAFTSSTGPTHLIYNRGVAGSVFASVTVTNNLVSAFSHSNNSTGVFYGILTSGIGTTTCALLALNNNTFVNSVSSATSGQMNLIYNTCPVTSSISLSNNLISDWTNSITTTGAFYAINNGGNSSLGDLTISNNIFRDLISSASSGSRYLIYNSGGITNSITIANNLISNCSHSVSAGGSLYGIYNNSALSGLSANLSNNTFTNNFSSSLNGSTYLLYNSGAMSTTITNVTMANNLADSNTHTATNGSFYGIVNSGFTSTNLSMATNTLSNITMSATASNQHLLYNNGRITTALAITDNLFSGFTNTVNASGNFYGVINTAAFAASNFPAGLNIANNRFLNIALTSSTGSIYHINNTGATTNTITVLTITNNLVSNSNQTLTGTGNWYGIYNTTIASGSLSINTNTFTNIAAASTSSSRYMIFNGALTVSSADISNNLISDFTSTVNTTGSYFGVNNGGNSQGNLTVNNNQFLNHSLTASTGMSHLVYNSGVITNTITVTGNFISNLVNSTNNSGGFIGIYNNSGSSSGLNISSNTFTNLSLSQLSGIGYLIQNNRAPGSATITTIDINNNTAGAWTYSSVSGQFCGIYNNNMSFSTLNITGNSLANIVSTTTSGARYFVYNTGVGSVAANINNNIFSGFTSSANTSGSFYGINNSGNNAGDLNITNNAFVNYSLSATSGSAFVVYNTGVISNSITIADNLVSGFTHSATATGGFLGLYNNAASSSQLAVKTNTFTNISLYTLTGPTHFLYSRGSATNAVTAITFSANVISSCMHSATSGPFYGIYNNAISFSNLNVVGNSFSGVVSTTSTSPRYFIYNTGAGTGGINLSSNVISNYTSQLNTTGVFYDILNSGACTGNLDINSNIFNTQVLPSTTGAAYCINNNAAISGSVTINNNQASAITHSSTTGVLYGLYTNGSLCTNLSVSGNTLSNISTNNAGNIKYLIYNTSPASNAIRINSNIISNYSAPLNTTGNFSGIYNTGNSQGSFEVSFNSLNNISLPATTGTCYAIYNAGTVTSSSDINNNLLTGVTYSSNAAGTFYGIYNLSSATSSLSASGNTLNTISVDVPATPVYMVYNTGSATTNIGAIHLNNNAVINLSNTQGSGIFYGIYNNAVSSASLSLSANTFSNCVSTTTGSIRYLVYNTGSVTTGMNMDNNLVGNYTSSLNTTANFYGIYNSALSSGNLSMNGNSFASSFLGSTNGTNYLVYNSAAVTNSVSLSNNSVSANTHSVTNTGSFYGIYNGGSGSAALNMNGNSFTNNFLGSTTGTNYLVYNTATVASNLTMNNNVISGNTNSLSAAGDFYGIYNTGSSSSDLSMDGNLFSNNTSAATNANTHLIYNSGVITNSVSISNNSLGYGFTNSGTNYSGTIYSIYNTGGASTTSLSINGNSFSAYSFTALPGTGNMYFVYNTNNNSRISISNNTWNALSLNNTGNQYLMYNPSSTSGVLDVNNNSVAGYTRTGAAASLYMYYSNGSSPGTCVQTFSANNFSNISAGTQGTGSFFGIYNVDGVASSPPKKLVSNNSISNVNYAGLGFFYGYCFDFLGDGASVGSVISNNTLSTVSWEGPLYGMYVGGNGSPLYATNVYSNTVYGINSSGATADVYGVYLQSAGSGLNFYKNRISDIAANGILGTADGIRISNAQQTSVSNNVIGNIITPSSSAVNALNGIHVSGGSRVNLYYNTVYLNGASTGSFFASNALYASSSVSLDLRNNILINTSVPNGTGVTVAYRRTGIPLGNYLSTSNNNIFYAGIPSASRLIFADGTNTLNTLPAYQAHVSPRDNVSAYENTAFMSLAGTNANFLHVDMTVPSLTENGAANITGITDDIEGQVRQGNPGYLGTGTAPDIGADEYNQALTPCTSANAGTVIVPSSTSKCAGQTIYMLSSGYTAAGDIVHQWKVSSTTGGPYVNVSGGTGANTPAYTTGSLSAGTYYFVLVTTCTLGSISATSNEVTVTVNPAPSASVSALSLTICSGQSLNFSGSSDIGTNYNWMGPNNFTSTAQNPTVTNGSTNASGIYTLLVSDANCTSTPAYLSATVQANPPTFSLTPSASSICIGGSQTITASIPITSPTLSFGNQTNQNTASGYPAPYSVYYGGQRMQILILANELAAAGFTVGTPIQSVQFPVSSLGASWNNTLHECQNFMIGVKATTVTSLSVFETGLTNVVSPLNYTPSIGYGNIHSFSAPFIWDGSSNLVIETVFSNSVIGTAGNAVIQYNSPTGFQSTLVYRADNQNVSAIAAATTSNINVGFVRPDFKLNGTQVGTYSWSPSVGLSATSGVSVIASPTASGVYTVALSDGQCSSTSTVDVNVILNPTINISASSSTVCLGNTATLTASGAATYTWSTSSTNTSIVVAPFTSTTFTVTGSNPACPSTYTTIFITSAPALALTANALPAVLCQAGSSTLSASGASTYTWTGGANTTSIVVSPSVTTNYTVIAYDGPGCWASKIVNVKINPLPVITITPSTANVCLGESATFEASGVFSFTWTPGNSNSPIFVATPLVSSGYTVYGSDMNNCTNSASVYVTVDPCTIISEPLSIGKGISLFPNPSSGIINIQFEFEGEKEIYIVNSLAEKIFETKTNDNLKTIDLSELAKGVYFVKVFANGTLRNYKVLID